MHGTSITLWLIFYSVLTNVPAGQETKTHDFCKYYSR